MGSCPEEKKTPAFLLSSTSLIRVNIKEALTCKAL